MVPYVIKCRDINNEHLVMFRLVVNLVNKLPEKPATGPGLTCHDVCAWLCAQPAVDNYLIHVRGWFGVYGYEHSWLEFTGERDRVIIDPDPWACASGPILVYAQQSSPWHGLYMTKKPKDPVYADNR